MKLADELALLLLAAQPSKDSRNPSNPPKTPQSPGGGWLCVVEKWKTQKGFLTRSPEKWGRSKPCESLSLSNRAPILPTRQQPPLGDPLCLKLEQICGEDAVSGLQDHFGQAEKIPSYSTRSGAISFFSPPLLFLNTDLI